MSTLFIFQLRETNKVDIYCYKTCYTEQASLVLATKALRIFTELDLDLQVSLLCLPPEPSAEPQQVAAGGPDANP